MTVPFGAAFCLVSSDGFQGLESPEEGHKLEVRSLSLPGTASDTVASFGVLGTPLLLE